MHIVNHHFRSRKTPASDLSDVPGAQKNVEEDPYHDEGRYRAARDYPVGVYSYLDYAEVENNAHNVANYDAAEALDLN
jgi:hypothetical protein